jgi:hypothetical protein
MGTVNVRARRRLSHRFTYTYARHCANLYCMSRSACLFLSDRGIFVTVVSQTADKNASLESCLSVFLIDQTIMP